MKIAADLSIDRLHRWQHCNAKVAAALLAFTSLAKIFNKRAEIVFIESGAAPLASPSTCLI